jgi:Alr-MurF fusion protein
MPFSYTLSDIARMCGGEVVIAHGDPVICDVVTDSRSHLLPVNALFFALRGAHHDGHDYIPDLVKTAWRLW